MTLIERAEGLEDERAVIRPEGPPAAERAVEHPDDQLRRAVVTAIGMHGRAEAVSALHRAVREGTDQSSTERHRSKGKATARERLEMLFDEGTFHEIQHLRRHRASGFGMEHRRPFSDGVVTGFGEVGGRLVYAFAVDARILGGSLGEAQAEKIQRCIDRAVETGAPLVAIHDGAGARVQEGGLALAGYGGIFRRHVAASGVIPQISVVLGTCAGGAAYAPALTDRLAAQVTSVWPRLVGRLVGQQGDYEYLQESSLTFASPDEVVEALRKAGFSECDYRRFLAGMLTVFWAIKRS